MNLEIQLKSEKGITLVALVITIIVLLILAGVTIATLTGDNGILNQANKAKATTEIGEEKDIIGLSVIQATNNNGTIDEDELQKALNEYSKEGNKASIIASDIENFTVKFESERYYEVNKGGSIEYIENATGKKILTVQCVNSKNELLKEYRYTIVTNDYSKAPPIIEGYEAQNERIIGKITEDTTIKILYYYLIQEDDLVFTGLDDTEKIISDNSKITSYMIGDNSNINSNGMVEKIDCESILNMPDTYNGKNIINVGRYAFFGCENIVKVIFSKNIQTISTSSFENCSKIEHIILNEGLITIKDHAFKNCYNIEELEIPDSLKILEPYCFEKLLKITEVIIPKNVTAIGDGVFYSCTSLEKVIYTENCAVGNTGSYRDATKFDKIEIKGESEKYLIVDNILYSKDQEKLLFIPTGREGKVVINDKVKIISEKSCLYCKKIQEVIIQEGVTTIKDHAFKQCTGIEKIKIAESVKTIESYALESLTKLTNIEIPKNVENIGTGAFIYCYNLDEVIIDSPFIVISLTDNNSVGGLLNYATTVYIKDTINEVGIYLESNYTKQEKSDKEGYIKYLKNT